MNLREIKSVNLIQWVFLRRRRDLTGGRKQIYLYARKFLKIKIHDTYPGKTLYEQELLAGKCFGWDDIWAVANVVTNSWPCIVSAVYTVITQDGYHWKYELHSLNNSL